MNTTRTTTGATGLTTTDLSGFFSMHAGFRHEFGRLADAARAPRDAAHEQLLEEQIALVLEMLHKHHHHEDEEVWPYLLERSPGSGPALDELEAEHQVLDPLMQGSGDTSRPLPERAETLRRLHEVVNDHLDHEERVGVPLMLEHFTRELLEAHAAQAMEDFGRKRVPVIFGWLASCIDDELLVTSLGAHPRIVRLLFKWFWWPSYQKRMAALYGASVRPVAVSLGGPAVASIA
jgi:hypothetical protein